MGDDMTQRAEEVQEKLEKLAALGTPEAIAMELEAQGIKATLTDAHSCAIAVYLGNSKIPGSGVECGDVGVTRSYVQVYTGPGNSYMTPIPTPPVVGQFIQDFDRHRFPAITEPFEGDAA